MQILITGLLLFSFGSLLASDGTKAPWERHVFDVESGSAWQFGSNTTINYQLVPTQFSWRSPFVLKHHLDGGGDVVVRNQASLITTWVANGPENYYLGISGAPSLEWWAANNMWSLYFSVGGGVGATNSTGVAGGLAQDFILNWFAKTGVRYQLNNDFAIFGGPYFQHMSDGGATDPNPGIDALGLTIGASYSF